MNKFILILSCVGLAFHVATAATVPANTTLTLKTTTNILSKDAAGKKFHGELVTNVSVQGRVILPAGTAVVGVVKSPHVKVGSSTRPLTLKLTQVSVNGHLMPIETEAFEAENASPYKSRRGVHVTGDAFLLPHGTTLQFRLIRPLNM